MFVKVLRISLVASLFLILVGGAVYILARPTETRAAYLERGGTDGAGRGGNQQSLEASEVCDTCEDGASGSGFAGGGRGRSNGVLTQESIGDGAFEQLGQGRGAASGLTGQGQGSESEWSQVWSQAEEPAWETVQGRVTDAGHDLLVETTSEGEVLVGLGPEFYREEQGFAVSVGDEVVVKGYHEDGEFKAGSVENSTTGTHIVLRDDTSGRPMWSGRGNLKNRS